MMCYSPSGYVIFSVRKLKFYGDRELRVGCEGRGPDNPNTHFNTADTKNICEQALTFEFKDNKQKMQAFQFDVIWCQAFS